MSGNWTALRGWPIAKTDSNMPVTCAEATLIKEDVQLTAATLIKDHSHELKRGMENQKHPKELKPKKPQPNSPDTTLDYNDHNLNEVLNQKNLSFIGSISSNSSDDKESVSDIKESTKDTERCILCHNEVANIDYHLSLKHPEVSLCVAQSYKSRKRWQ